MWIYLCFIKENGNDACWQKRESTTRHGLKRVFACVGSVLSLPLSPWIHLMSMQMPCHLAHHLILITKWHCKIPISYTENLYTNNTISSSCYIFVICSLLFDNGLFWISHINIICLNFSPPHTKTKRIMDLDL